MIFSLAITVELVAVMVTLFPINAFTPLDGGLVASRAEEAPLLPTAVVVLFFPEVMLEERSDELPLVWVIPAMAGYDRAWGSELAVSFTIAHRAIAESGCSLSPVCETNKVRVASVRSRK